MTPEDLAALFRNLREQTGMSQGEASRRAKLHHTTVSMWEKGKNLSAVANYLTAIEAMGYRWPVPKVKR